MKTDRTSNLERLYQVLDVFPAVNYLMLRRLAPELDLAATRNVLASLHKMKDKVSIQISEDGVISLGRTGALDVDRMIAYWVYNHVASATTTIDQMIGGRGESELYFQDDDRLYAIIILSTSDCRSRSLHLSEGTLDGEDVTFLFAFIAQREAAEREQQIRTLEERIVPPLHADYKLLAVDLGPSLYSRPQITEIQITNKERRL